MTVTGKNWVGLVKYKNYTIGKEQNIVLDQ